MSVAAEARAPRTDRHKLRPGFAGLDPEQWSGRFAGGYAEGVQVEGRLLHGIVMLYFGRPRWRGSVSEREGIVTASWLSGLDGCSREQIVGTWGRPSRGQPQRATRAPDPGERSPAATNPRGQRVPRTPASVVQPRCGREGKRDAGRRRASSSRGRTVPRRSARRAGAAACEGTLPFCEPAARTCVGTR